MLSTPHELFAAHAERDRARVPDFDVLVEKNAATMARELDVVRMRSESAEDALARHVRDRKALLVLDNFEHVLEAAPVVAGLLAATTTLRILATLLAPSAGTAEIAGLSVTWNPDDVRRVIGFMPDAFGV
jgi:predicted ATPase